MSTLLSRRALLRLAALAAGGMALGGCQEIQRIVGAPVATPVPAVVEAPPKEVRLARCGWLEAEMPLDHAIAIYNTLPERAEDRIEIILDPAGKATTDPVLGAMMAAGEEIPWNTHVCFTPFLETVSAIELGTVQAFDPYLEASAYPEAASRVQEDMIPSVRADNSYQGELFAIPTNVDVICYMYRRDYLEAVGAQAPQTMDEALEIAVAVTQHFADDDILGFAPTPAVTWRYIAALHQAYSPPDRLFTADGLLNILDDGWVSAMEITKQFIDAGTVPDGWETWGYPDTWKMGKVATAINQHSMGTWGGMIWGYDKLAMMPTPPGDPAIAEAGTMFWATSIPLFKAATYPQETTDFLVWMVDPENAIWNEGVFKAGKMSGFRASYAKYIDPNDVTENWALAVLPLLEAATPPPPTKWYITQHNMIVPRLIEFLTGVKPAQQAMQEAWDAIQEEIARAA